MVGKVCTVCRRRSFIDRHLSFFTYPGDRQRRHEWLIVVDRMDLMRKVDNDKTRSNYRICELHFEQKYVIKSKSCEGRKFLTHDAFPTLCLDSSLVVPLPSEKLIKPPSPRIYPNDIIWKEYEAVTTMDKKLLTAYQSKTHAKPERRSRRQEEMALKKKVVYYPTEESSDEGDTVDSSPSSPSYEDVSQFCESVLKVTKCTQTNGMEGITKQRNINTHDMNIRTGEPASNDQQSFIQMCSTFLPPSLTKIIKWNLNSYNGRKNINFILFAINLYYSSNSYNLLRDMLSLPTEENLKYFLLPKCTRLSENFINAFKCKVNNMSPKERVCSLSVGSILLKPQLYYDIKHDRIIGVHDVNGKQNLNVAKYAVLLTLEGILENWRQPIAYAFISEYDDYPEISSWIDEILKTLIYIGLDIRAFVSDPRSEYLYASETRFVTPEKSFFTINGTDIFYTYDTTQLLKIVKNNLKSCYFDYGPNSNIRNNDEFFGKLNDLYNILNSKTQFANSPYKRAFANKKYQNKFLHEMLQLFRNLKVVRKADGADVTENMKFVKGFQITINSVLQLFEELSFLGVKHLLTSRLNHHSLNRFLTKVKPLHSKGECTPRQFNRAFVRSFVFNMLKKPLGDANIQNSFESEDFTQQFFDEEFQDTQNNTIKPLSVNTTDYRWGLPEKNAFVYVCGYCYLKCIQQHKCDIFRSYLKDIQSRQQNADVFVCSVNLDFNVSSRKTVPPDEFIEFLMLLETKFIEYFTPDLSISNVGHDIMQKIQNLEFGMPCPCFPIDYLKALFVRVRLYYTIRKNNKLLMRRKGVKTVRVYSL